MLALGIAARTAIATLALAVLTSKAAAAASLIDQRGTAFSLSDLRGAPVVLTFVAARCTDACPLIEAQIAATVRDHRARGIRFVTVTLDPEHDTAASMRAIAQRFDARAPAWRVASGPPALIHAMLQQYDVQLQRGSGGIPEMHTTFVYIIDARGRLQRMLLASPQLTESIFEVIEP